LETILDHLTLWEGEGGTVGMKWDSS